MDSKSSIKVVASQSMGGNTYHDPKTSNLEPATPTKSTEKNELESKRSQQKKDLKSSADTFDQEKILSGQKEAFKDSSASANVNDGISSVANTSGSANISEKTDLVESGKSSMCRGSTSIDVSDESSCSSLSSSMSKSHKSNDSRWEAIQAVRSKDGNLGLSHFRVLKRLVEELGMI